jgi:hypothetical protein
MHPETFAAGGNETGATQIGEVARNFGLAGLQALDEEADADFVIAHEVKQAKASPVGESFEKSVEADFLFEIRHIWLDRYSTTELYSRGRIYVFVVRKKPRLTIQKRDGEPGAPRK